jgi:ketosteroid isomerase-like protein
MSKFKSYLLFSIILVSCTQPSKTVPTAPINLQKEISAIHEVMNQQAIAWNNADIEGYMQGYWNSDSLIFTGGKSKTTGWRQAIDRYKKSYPDKAAMGALTFSDLATEVTSAQSAYTTGAWKVETDANVADGRFTLVWRKKQNKWRIVADHSS